MMAKNKHLSPAGTVTRAEVSQSMKAHAGWSAQWGQVLLPITGTGLGTSGQEGAPAGPVSSSPGSGSHTLTGP